MSQLCDDCGREIPDGEEQTSFLYGARFLVRSGPICQNGYSRRIWSNVLRMVGIMGLLLVVSTLIRGQFLFALGVGVISGFWALMAWLRLRQLRAARPRRCARDDAALL